MTPIALLTTSQEVSAVEDVTILDEKQEMNQAQHDLDVTADDLLEAKEFAASISLQDLHAVFPPAQCKLSRIHSTDLAQIMTRVYKIHQRDPNFPATVLAKIQQLLGTPHSQPSTSHSIHPLTKLPF